SGILVDINKGDHPAGNEELGFQSMPAAWVRAIMLVSCNNITRGHSGVSLGVIEAILKLIRNDFTPRIPLRGTISASGDLKPLSYIAGAIEGSPDIWIRTGKEAESKNASAKEALEMASLKPITLGPKEGLGLINGTAASAALASLAL
ncbi:MAG: hypothetical protein M1830_005843, partial [Pleopsidium flavum]